LAQSSENTRPQRFDPYRDYRFRVKWDGRHVAGVSKFAALKRARSGRMKYEPITLERGVTHDEEFFQWANTMTDSGSARDAEHTLKELRKDIVLEVYDEAGQLAFAYRVYRCWVSEFQALPELDAGANAVAIQILTLQHEGRERDDDVKKPSGATFSGSAG